MNHIGLCAVHKYINITIMIGIANIAKMKILSIIYGCGKLKNGPYCPSILIESTFFAGVSYNRSNFGSGNFGGNFYAGDNYTNIGGAGSSVGGNQSNTGGMGGPANQSSGFRRQRPQEHDSGHMGLHQ